MKYLLLATITFVCGCVSMPTQQGQVYDASYVGDRSTEDLDEIVVALPGNDLRNLHLFFAAIINPTKVSTGKEGDIQWIIRRTHARVSSAITEAVSSGSIDFSKDRARARQQLIELATTIFSDTYSKWSHSAAFKVEIVITSMYLTDGSVGKSEKANPFGW